MKSSILLPLLLLALATHLPAQSPAKLPRMMYVTFDNTPVYDSASYLSNVIADLRRGDSVEALAADKKFYRITIQGRDGYLLKANVGDRRPAPPRQKAAASSTAASDSSTSPRRPKSSRRTPDAAAQSDAASVQCRAFTKSGKQCSRRTNDPSGYCWQHKK